MGKQNNKIGNKNHYFRTIEANFIYEGLCFEIYNIQILLKKENYLKKNIILKFIK